MSTSLTSDLMTAQMPLYAMLVCGSFSDVAAFAAVSAMSFPAMFLWPGTHCMLRSAGTESRRNLSSAISYPCPSKASHSDCESVTISTFSDPWQFVSIKSAARCMAEASSVTERQEHAANR